MLTRSHRVGQGRTLIAPPDMGGAVRELQQVSCGGRLVHGWTSVPIPFSVGQYDGLVSDVGYDVSFGTPAKSSYLRCISAMTFRRRG
jgi:hypothetical protein